MPIFPFRRRGRHHGRATFPHVPPAQRRRRVPVGAVVALAVLAALLAVAAVLIVSTVAGVTR